MSNDIHPLKTKSNLQEVKNLIHNDENNIINMEQLIEVIHLYVMKLPRRVENKHPGSPNMRIPVSQQQHRQKQSTVTNPATTNRTRV